VSLPPMKTCARADCRDELRRRLRALGPESPRRWGTMTAPQMVCHLIDAGRMATGRSEVASLATPLRRTVVKWLALYAPLRWPSGIQTVPELDQVAGAGTSPSEFAADIAEVERLLDEIAEWPAGTPWPAHPIFGRMSHRAWLRWAYLHTDHHLRQFGG
jgi:hypothetical protein